MSSVSFVKLSNKQVTDLKVRVTIKLGGETGLPGLL